LGEKKREVEFAVKNLHTKAAAGASSILCNTFFHSTDGSVCRIVRMQEAIKAPVKDG
jgi:hypothetical protein